MLIVPPALVIGVTSAIERLAVVPGIIEDPSKRSGNCADAHCVALIYTWDCPVVPPDVVTLMAEKLSVSASNTNDPVAEPPSSKATPDKFQVIGVA